MFWRADMSYKDLHRKTLIAFHQSISAQPYAFKTIARNTIFYHDIEHRLVSRDPWWEKSACPMTWW